LPSRAWTRNADFVAETCSGRIRQIANEENLR
jgi:hypothetical protein